MASRQSKKIVMGKGHVPLYALRPGADEIDAQIAQAIMTDTKNVAVIRFDLTDRESFWDRLIDPTVEGGGLD